MGPSKLYVQTALCSIAVSWCICKISWQKSVPKVHWISLLHTDCCKEYCRIEYICTVQYSMIAACMIKFTGHPSYRPFLLRHLLAEKQLRGSKRLPKYAFSASKEKSHYNLKNVKVWRPWGRIFSPICPTSRPYTTTWQHARTVVTHLEMTSLRPVAGLMESRWTFVNLFVCTRVPNISVYVNT